MKLITLSLTMATKYELTDHDPRLKTIEHQLQITSQQPLEQNPKLVVQ
jgi:hypothetical protein